MSATHRHGLESERFYQFKHDHAINIMSRISVSHVPPEFGQRGVVWVRRMFTRHRSAVTESSFFCAFVGMIHCQNAIKAVLYVLCNRVWHFVGGTRRLAWRTDSNRSFARSYANACTRNSLYTVEALRTCNAITSPTRMLNTIA